MGEYGKHVMGLLASKSGGAGIAHRVSFEDRQELGLPERFLDRFHGSLLVKALLHIGSNHVVRIHPALYLRFIAAIAARNGDTDVAE
ncbi:hypothetical protein ACX0FC_16230, partial [Enterococcus faecium]